MLLSQALCLSSLQAGGPSPGVWHWVSSEESQSQEQNAEFLGETLPASASLGGCLGVLGASSLVKAPSELAQDEPGRDKDPALNSRFLPAVYQRPGRRPLLRCLSSQTL